MRGSCRPAAWTWSCPWPEEERASERASEERKPWFPAGGRQVTAGSGRAEERAAARGVESARGENSVQVRKFTGIFLFEKCQYCAAAAQQYSTVYPVPVQYYTVLYLCCTVLYVQYCTVLYSIYCCTVLTVLYCIVLWNSYCTVQYCTVQ